MRDDELLRALEEALADADADVAEPDPERVAAIRAAAVAKSDRRSSGAPDTDAAVVSLSSRRRGPLLAGAIAALLLLVAGFGAVLGLALSGDDGPDTDGVVEYAGPITGASGAEGELSVVLTGIGRVVELDTRALEILPTGEFYEVWFVAPDDTPAQPNRISAGTFHPDEAGRSEVRFAAAVDPTLFPLLQITAEPGDGDPRASGVVVMEARLDQ